MVRSSATCTTTLCWRGAGRDPMRSAGRETARWRTSRSAACGFSSLRAAWDGLALEPLRDKLEDHQVDSLIEALGLVVGAEAVVTLLDVLHLSPEAAKQRQL